MLEVNEILYTILFKNYIILTFSQTNNLDCVFSELLSALLFD